MIILAESITGGRVSVIDCDAPTASEVLRTLRSMRWAQIKRHGRSGHRWYTVTLRNRSEWKSGAAVLHDVLVRLA